MNGLRSKGMPASKSDSPHKGARAGSCLEGEGGCLGTPRTSVGANFVENAVATLLAPNNVTGRQTIQTIALAADVVQSQELCRCRLTTTLALRCCTSTATATPSSSPFTTTSIH